MQHLEKSLFTIFLVLSFLCLPISATDVLQIKGSNQMVPIIRGAAEEYSRTHPNISLLVLSTNRAEALRLVSNGSIDIALIADSIEPLKNINLSTLQEISIGRMAVAIIVHSENPVSSLSLQEIQDIFHQKITNWRQVGGNNQVIVTVGRKDPASPTGNRSAIRDLFLKVVLNESESNVQSKIELDSNDDILRFISNTPNAIGYIEYKYVDPEFSFNLKTRIKALGISSGSSTVVPSLETIATKVYPFYENLNVYTVKTPNNQVQEFITYLLSSEGQSFVKSNGYCPIVGKIQTVWEISSPTTILSPGTYLLDQDLTTSDIIPLNAYNESAYIQISSNAVTFDGMGKSIDCQDVPPHIRSKGIACGYKGPEKAFMNLIIKNVTITNCTTGINVLFYDNVLIDNVTLLNNGEGLYFFTSKNIVISQSNFNSIRRNIGCTNSNNISLLKGTNTIDESEIQQCYQMPVTPYNWDKPLRNIDTSFLLFLVFVPLLITKFGLESIVEYVSKRFFTQISGIITRISQSWFRVSLIGAVVLGWGFYYSSSFRYFDLVTFGIFFLIGIIVVVSRETMIYLTAKKLGLKLNYCLWEWGVCLIIISALFKNPVGQPILTKFDKEHGDIKREAYTLLSGLGATILLAIPFIYFWLYEDPTSLYAFFLLDMSIVTSFVAFLPISPLDGEIVVKWNRYVWAAVFVLLLASLLYLNYYLVINYLW